MWYTVIRHFWFLPELLSLFSRYQMNFWYTVNIIWVCYQWGNNASAQISHLLLQCGVTAGCSLASPSARKVATLMCLRKARRRRNKPPPAGVLFPFLLCLLLQACAQFWALKLQLQEPQPSLPACLTSFNRRFFFACLNLTDLLFDPSVTPQRFAVIWRKERNRNVVRMGKCTALSVSRGGSKDFTLKVIVGRSRILNALLKGHFDSC